MRKKSVFEPVQEIEWLGLCLKSPSFSMYLPERRMSDAKANLARITSLLPMITARQLACLTGKIISMSPVMGNIVRLMRRKCYKAIDARNGWDRFLTKSWIEFITPELCFWSRNMEKYNNRSLLAQFRKDVIVYSDASDHAGAAYTVEVNEHIFHMTWSEYERGLSSTWRELKAIEQALMSFSSRLQGRSLKWFTDNQDCARIVESGSTKFDLQTLAFNSFSTCLSRGINLDVQWIPRTQNLRAAYISKIMEFEDWGTTHDFFIFMNNLWGPFTIDRFASHTNTKLARFNSVFWNPGTENVDCFSVNWANDNNWLVPPISLVGKCILYLVQCKAKGALIIPKWPSAYFWPILFRENGCQEFVADVLEFTETSRVFQHGMNVNSVFGSKGQITISSDSSPLFGIQFLAIPFAFDFAFKMHIKEKSFKHSIN